MITESMDVTGRAGCTVRAFAQVTGVSLEWANGIAAAAGRRKGRGFYSWKLIDYAKTVGYKFRKLRMKPRTLARFLREHPAGRYYLVRSRHAFAVVDGNVLTMMVRARTRVLIAWQYIGEPKS